MDSSSGGVRDDDGQLQSKEGKVVSNGSHHIRIEQARRPRTILRICDDVEAGVTTPNDTKVPPKADMEVIVVADTKVFIQVDTEVSVQTDTYGSSLALHYSLGKSIMWHLDYLREKYKYFNFSCIYLLMGN